MSIERSVRDNPTLDDLDYDALIARLAVNVRDLKEETDIAAQVVAEVSEVVQQTEQRVSSQIDDAVSAGESGLNTRSSKGARTSATHGNASSSGVGRASGQQGETAAGSVAASGSAAAIGATAAMGAGKAASSGANGDTSHATGMTDKAAGGTAAGKGFAGSDAADAAGSGSGSYSGGGSSGGVSAGTGQSSGSSPSSLHAGGLSPAQGSGSSSHLQKLMDQVFGGDSSTSPANSLSSAMAGQMKGFSEKWSGFERAAIQSQNAAGIDSMGLGEAAFTRISAGFSGLVEAGGKGFSAFGSCVSVAVTRYGRGVATVASTVTFIATSVNGALSFTPSAISHAVQLGTTRLGVGGLSPISFGQLFGK
jgi:hypothetical protein